MADGTSPTSSLSQGVAMLSSVLSSERAITVNIEIMRAFIKLRQLLASNTELADNTDCGHFPGKKCDGVCDGDRRRNCVDQNEYLRVFVGNLRKKIEGDVSNPRYIITETLDRLSFHSQLKSNIREPQLSS